MTMEPVGYKMAMDIVTTFPPRYWKKRSYKHKPCKLYEIDEDYNYSEYRRIETAIEIAQEENYLDYFDNISELYRVQNPFSYSRFLLNKRHYEKYHDVYQYRKFKIIKRSDVKLCLKYNLDSRRLGGYKPNFNFYPTLPNIWENRAVLVAQVLQLDDDDDEDLIIECENDNDFYVEYVAYFD